ncbi:MAG TPA: hypothetical protein VL614_18165 [Acetobacteraceae bacterium]|nr:hypothetical protein [Acetobacteraceae bacterium]
MSAERTPLVRLHVLPASFFEISVSNAWQSRCRKWAPSPFNSGGCGQCDGNDEQSDDDQALDRPIVLIWIPAGHQFDPVRKYRRDERQQPTDRRQAGFNPEQAPNVASHVNPPWDADCAGP